MQKDLQEKFTEERAVLQQNFDEAITVERAELKQQYDAEITTERAQLKQQYDAEIIEGRATVQAELQQQFEIDLESERVKQVDAIAADLQQQYNDQIDEERVKLKISIRAEVEESFQGESDNKIGKTVVQDAEKSDKTDGQDIGATSKTDGQDAELEKVSKQLRDLQEKHKLVQAELEAERGSLAECCEEFKDLIKQEQVVAKSLESSESQVVKLETALQVTNESLQKTKAEIEEKNGDIKALRKENKKQLRRLDAAEEKEDAVREYVADLRLAGNEAKANADSLKEANDRLLKTNNDLASQLRAREPGSIQETLDLVVQEKAGLEADLQRSAAEKDLLESRDGSHRQEIRQCRAQLVAVQLDLDAANSRTVALTRDFEEVRQAQAGFLADILRLEEEKAALAEARKTGKEGRLGVPRWLMWQLALLAPVSSFFLCAFSLFCFLGLAVEREAQQWLGGNDLPRAASFS